jgi:hypothetical protein
MPWDIKKCMFVGFHKVLTDSQNCLRRSVFRSLPFWGRRQKLLVTDHHWGWNVDPSLWTADKKTFSGMASFKLSSAVEAYGWLFSWESSCPLLFWDAEDFGRHCALWWNHELRSKSCRSISGEFSLTYMWMKSSFSLVVCDYAQTWKPRTQSQNSDRSSSPTIQPASCCLKFSSLWSSLRCHQWGKAWEWWQGYWKNEEMSVSTKFRLTGRGQEEERCSCFLLVHCCWSWWRLCRKMRCIIHPCSLPVGMSGELCKC